MQYFLCQAYKFNANYPMPELSLSKDPIKRRQLINACLHILATVSWYSYLAGFNNNSPHASTG